VTPKPLHLRPAARGDILAIAGHYRADAGLGIALAFTDALQRVLHHVGHRSEQGSARFAPALDLPGLRAWPIPRFPHLVLAFERPGHFDVLRILHAKRDVPVALR
jgi:toxin ParE1/3/4